ncbi:MAG: acyl-CoA dehydrogenase family protein [Acidimicrobiia bacterium]|nr:acyl-CoA dehydrogenase family protein [Acidimicrobiia bacterium]
MLELSATQDELREHVARFAGTEIEPNARVWDEGEAFPRSIFSKLGELGWLGVGIGEAFGGSGGGPVERCILIEELARASAAVTLGVYVHAVLASGALAVVAGPDLAHRHLPPLLAGERIGAWAYAEPGGRCRRPPGAPARPS